MSSVKNKLAALRAKRSKQKQTTLSLSDPDLSAAALAVGAPQVSWDADYKHKLEQSEPHRESKDVADSSCSSDEDEDELVVLPPPTRKLNPAAQRQMWRRREIERAKEKAARTLLELRPESFDVEEVPLEPCSEETNLSEEAKREESQRGPDASDDYDDDEEEEEGDGTTNHQAPGFMTGENDQEQDEEEAALKTAQLIEEEEHEDAIDELPLAPSPDVPDEDTREAIPENCNNTSIQTSIPVEEAQPVSSDATQATVATNAADSKDQLATETPSETKKSDVQITSTTVQTSAVTVKKSRKSSWFVGWKKAPEKKKPEQPFKTGFVEDEADEDDASKANGFPGEEGCSDGVVSNDDADQDVDEYENLGEENVNASGNKKLAVFHQKWILDKEKEELEAMKTVPGRMMINAVDEAMDLTELAQSKNNADDQTDIPSEEQKNISEDKENLSEAGEDVLEENDRISKGLHDSEDYVDAMFLRDDSRSRILEKDEQEKEGNGGEDIAKREKARALWKARQKTKISLVLEDENSLSRFDIFGDADKSRSTHFRERLEKACRPVSLQDLDEKSKTSRDQSNTGTKRNFPWTVDASIPEWEKRNASMQQRQRKRQRSVSVGKWSFATRSTRDKPQAKATRMMSAGTGGSSLGSTYQALKPRVNGIMAKRTQTSNRGAKAIKRPSAKAPTTVRGLLRVLGGRAETDM